jgi:hypothetical protein
MKINIIILSILLFAQIGFSQAPPQGINYQAVVYSDNGNNQPGLNVPGQLLLKKSIRVRFTIIANATNGNEVYKESHATTTDAFGMFSLVIGQGTQESLNSFPSINWGTGKHFLKVEIDKSGGTNYITMSNQQLWSVPYALYSHYAATADSAATSAHATTADFSTNSAHADSSDYADLAGNGITGVTDNGNGTLTFTYLDGSSYTTGILSGLTGPQGPAGVNGQNGLSSYEIWLAQGNTGAEQDFLSAIMGAQGPQGIQGPAGQNGANGQNGLSAYEVWLAQGNTGTETDFLSAITGAQGPQGIQGPAGQNGTNGQSAYDIWLAQGNTGTQQDFLNSLQGGQGTNGQNGLSAYEIWISQGNTGTEQDFLNSLQANSNSSGPSFISPINLFQLNGTCNYLNNTLNVNLNLLLGLTPNSVIISFELLSDQGCPNPFGYLSPIVCFIDLINQANTYQAFKLESNLTGTISTNVVNKTAEQVILPVNSDGTMNFNYTVSRCSITAKIIGYYN